MSEEQETYTTTINDEKSNSDLSEIKGLIQDSYHNWDRNRLDNSLALSQIAIAKALVSIAESLAKIASTVHPDYQGQTSINVQDTYQEYHNNLGR
jgi:hypothetical protein